jgi:hypothetical protein
VNTAHIGDPAAHRRALGPIGARRLDNRLPPVGADSWRELDDLAVEDDQSVDEALAVGAFCAVGDVDRAVAAVRRVLRSGGRLRFVEHVGRPGAMGLLQRLAAPTWASLPIGCHVEHDLVASLRRGGFVVCDLERWTVPSVVPILRHWVEGVAMVEDAT